MATTAAPHERFPLTSVPLDSEALACWELAGWVGMQSSDDHLRSYTSLLIALLHGDNGLSRWFLRYARAAGIRLDELYASRQFRPASVRDLKARVASGAAPEGKPAFTVSARHVAEGGAQLLRETGSSEFGVRHFLGAYMYRVPHVHVDQMRAWGFDLQRDGSAFVRQMKAHHPSEAERWEKVHAAALGAPPDLHGSDPILPPRISSFAADTPEGDDQLNIEDDLYALSALICSTQVSPPLSIGIFGDWGSGKSFFIKKLQRGVSWISQQARESGRMQKDVKFYKHVVQIEFNAWNYSGGNLWASLVQHILENLRLTPDDSDDLVAKRVNHLKQQMQLEQQVRDAATARQSQAQEEVKNSQEKLDELRRQHDADVQALRTVLAADVLATVELEQGTVAELNAIRRELKLPTVAASAGEFLAAVDGTRKVFGRTSALLEYVPADQRQRFMWNSALVLVAPPIAAVVIGASIHWLSPYLASLSALAGWVSASLALGARWLQQRTHDLNKPLATLERLQSHARQRVEVEQQKHRAEAASLEQQIALARDEILAAQAKQQESEAKLQRIEAELASTTPARVLAEFVKERSQSEDYRQHLGLPAVIRRDFESISRMVAQENEKLKEAKTLDDEEVNAAERINRIVLYVDDLDRCPEPLVIDVLKAVHLLLAFKLFVVVVAVDARWVSRSLAQQFPGLLTPPQAAKSTEPDLGTPDPTHATPSDYLEKIFQIPFWLRAPDEEAVKRMVRGLVSENSPRDTVTIRQDGASSGTEEAKRPQAPPVFKRRQHDPNATALDIHGAELEYIELLAPLLGRSPRVLKRFVNVYRLLKASLSSEEEDGFLDADGGIAPFEAVLFLLALVTGLPDLSGPLFEGLAEPAHRNGGSRSPASGTVNSVLSALANQGDAVGEQAARLTAWLDAHRAAWKSAPPAALFRWIPRVARYSFHLHSLPPQRLASSAMR